MKKKLPIILIVVSIILIVLNIITNDSFDNGFWMQTLASVLLIFSMVGTIYNNNKKK